MQEYLKFLRAALFDANLCSVWELYESLINEV